MTDKTALITGGAGFIGSHLGERLLSEGMRVVALDDLSTGSRGNIQHLTGNDDFQLVVANVADSGVTGPLIREVDIVYHLAAAVGVRLIVEEPLSSMTTNIKGTETVLEAANRWQTPVLIASTSEVYGKNTKVPFSEDDDLVFGSTRNARWNYACSKAIDEFLAIAYHRDNGLPVTIARLFNTVGPRQTGHYGMVIPRFVRQALRGDPITVYGDGSQRRTFTHVLDAVDAVFRLSVHPEAAGQVFNIGGASEISIMDLAILIKNRVASTSEIQRVPYRDAFGLEGFEDMFRRVPDLTKINSLNGYRPTFSLDDMVDSVVEYFRENPDFA